MEYKEKTFNLAKLLLSIHFDPPLLLSCDASEYGISAVLEHCLLDGAECPIGFVSRGLSKAECSSSQIEKEICLVVFGILYSPVHLITDQSINYVTKHTETQ